MDRNIAYKAALVAAIAGFFSALYMGFGVSLPVKGVSIQPTLPVASDAGFLRASNEFPHLALRFFTADTFFIISYLLVFLGLFFAVADRVRAFAWMGLGAGILTGVLDSLENSFYITYAFQSLRGIHLTDPALPLIYILTNLKWMGAFVAFAAFALVWPRKGLLGWLISAVMFLFVLIGVLGLVMPVLIGYRGLFFFVGMFLFALFFWRQLRKE
jgi:hypothetical protein